MESQQPRLSHLSQIVVPKDVWNEILKFSKSPLNLYLISQNVNISYDTYDSAVVSSPNEETARLIHPSSGLMTLEEFHIDDQRDWTNNPKDVKVELLGSYNGTEIKVICASFNAG